MKLITFLIAVFMVFMVFMVLKPVHAYWDKEFEVFDEIVYVTRGSNSEALITIGDEVIALGNKLMRYHINKVTTDGTNYIIFGYIFDRTLYTYDAVLYIVDTSFNLVCHHIIDLGDLEEFKDMFWLNDTLIFQIAKTTSEPGFYQHVSQHFLIFDETYETYEIIEISEEVIRKVIIDDKVHLSDTYHGLFHTAFNKDLEIFSNGIIYGLDESNYIDSKTLFYLNFATLDGTITPNSVTLDYPGYYHLSYQGNNHLITIDPYINGVFEGARYESAMSIFVSKGFVYLNNDLYVSNSIITEPGFYTLRIEGANGYIKTIDFALTNRLVGVIDQEVYNNIKTITFVGEGYLNGQLIHSGYTLTHSGDYILELFGINGYSEVHQFSLQLNNETQVPANQTLMFLEIGLISIALTLGGILIYKSRMKKT